MDNQGKPAEMADQSGAHSAGLKNPEDVHELCDKCSHAQTIDKVPLFGGIL